jgi:hypothetical protein
MEYQGAVEDIGNIGDWVYDCEHSGTFYSRDGRKLAFQPPDANGRVMSTIYRSGPA